MGARGPELRATWARLRIEVNREPVTLLVDRDNRSVREAVDLPLYPLAEWIATNWWFLIAEVETPGKTPSEEYGRRHNLRFAQEGYALPDLSIRPLGQRVQLEWSPAARRRQRVDFVSQGSAVIDIDEFRNALQEFVTAVVRRLEDLQVHHTLLAQEWTAVSQAEPEEAAFCHAAASLGLHPYAVSDDQVAAILRVAEQLPASIARDFFNVAQAEALTTQAVSVLESLRAAEENPANLDTLRTAKSKLHVPNVRGMAPWRQGYQYARAFRRSLDLNGKPVVGTDGLMHALRISDRQYEQAVIHRETQPPSVDALIGYNQAESPGFVIAARSEEGKRFALCRGLFEYLAAEDLCPSMVSHSHSERQKRNRAFAAEFLVPADALRTVVPSDSVSEEFVEELASAYQVSSFTIRHQLENHEIARVESE